MCRAGLLCAPVGCGPPPARLGSLTSFGAAPRSPPVPSGALHTRGAGLRRGRRPAREPSALRAFGSARRLESRPGPATAHGHRSQAPPPPTGTAADPSGALHTGGAVSLECGWVRRLEARPGPVPRSVPYPQFRMQFPDTCSSSLSEKPGISTITFQSMKCAWGNCMRICTDQASPPLTGTAAWSLYSLGASWGFRVLSFWGALVRVVTNVVNPSAF